MRTQRERLGLEGTPIDYVGPLQVPLSSCLSSFSPLLTSLMLSPLPRAFGRLLEDRLLCRSTSGQARPRRRSCRASSTICTAASGGNPLVSPPKSPDARAASYRGSSTCSPSPRRHGC